jgi:predicted ATP-dependent endonuclease of OLD family
MTELMLPMSILFMNEDALQRLIEIDVETLPDIWGEFDDEQKLFHHLQSCFVGFQKLIDAGFSPQENDSLIEDFSDWIIENCEEICEVVLSIKEYFLLRTYEKGVQLNRARKTIFQKYGDIPLFDKSKLSYSFEDWNFLDVIDLCRSHLELIHSYLIPNYRIHTKNEFTREMIDRYTGVGLKTIYVGNGRRPKLTLNDLDVKFDDLSSGQKRIIQLITSLLSNEVKGPIMIDEPEISLHPKWLTELKEIITSCIKYSRRQVIICTHSPELVYLFDDAIPIENFPKDEE